MEETKKTHNILLVLTVIFGFIFRLINVNTRIVLGDPPHFLVQAINFFHSGLLVVWDQSNYLWYAFTSIFYNLFGITQFASRFSSLLFGTLSILAVYLFVLEFSNRKRLALICAMIYAFAPGFIWQTADEIDISAIFFIILAFYTLIVGLKRQSKWYLVFSAVFFGVSAMWKAYVAILLVPYLGFIWYYHRTKRFDAKKNWKFIALLLAIILILVTPTFVYNYSNYKHNKVVDFLFATFLKIKNDKIYALYGWTAGQEVYDKGGIGNMLYRLFIKGNLNSTTDNHSIFYRGFESLYSNGHILLFLAIIGIIFMCFKRKDIFAKDYLVFFGLYFVIPFTMIIYGNFLSKHLVQFDVFALPIIAYLIDEIYIYVSAKSEKLNKLKSKPYVFYIAYAAIILFVFFVLLSRVTQEHQAFLSSNPDRAFINYKLSNIPEDSLIIYDDRIYNSLAGWLFNDRYYIPTSFLQDFLSINANSTNRQTVPVYLVECAIDDCGWGSISSNQQLNKSMDGFFASLQNQSIPLVYTVKSKVSNVNYYNPLISSHVEQPDYFRIYRAQMDVDLNLARQVKMQYEYFLYPTGYLNKNSQTFKNFIYTPSGFFEESANSFAWFIFYLNIFLSFMAIIFILYEIYLRS